jgi:hypothetical protein
MKSAYELAMERLEKTAPKVDLTDEQKARLAEVDSLYQSKIAERKPYVSSEIAKAQASHDFARIQELEQQLAQDLARFARQIETEKDKVRESFTS